MPATNAPEPFVILADTFDGHLAVPAASARAAQTAARQLAEWYPRVRATWQVSSQPAPGLVAVFGCVRLSAGEHLLDQHVHAYLLAPGDPLPQVWIALCGHRIDGAEFDAVDHGAGRPCPGCHQRWTALEHQPPGCGLG